MDFRLWLKEQGRSKETIRTYTSRLSSFNQTGRAFTTANIRAHMAEESKRLHPDSVNQKLAALRAYGEYLVDTKQFKDNPASKVKPVKVAKQPVHPDVLSDDELQLFRDTVESGSFEDYALLETLLHTGVRVSELVSIESTDISGDTLKIRNGKGGKYREVYINSHLRDILDRLDRHGRLFPLNTDAVRRMLRKYAVKVGIDGVHPHLFRHQFATKLRRRGEDIGNIAAMLGHRNLQTTMIYTAPTAAEKRRAVEGLF